MHTGLAGGMRRPESISNFEAMGLEPELSMGADDNLARHPKYASVSLGALYCFDRLQGMHTGASRHLAGGLRRQATFAEGAQRQLATSARGPSAAALAMLSLPQAGNGGAAGTAGGGGGPAASAFERTRGGSVAQEPPGGAPAPAAGEGRQAAGQAVHMPRLAGPATPFTSPFAARAGQGSSESAFLGFGSFDLGFGGSPIASPVAPARHQQDQRQQGEAPLAGASSAASREVALAPAGSFVGGMRRHSSASSSIGAASRSSTTTPSRNASAKPISRRGSKARDAASEAPAAAARAASAHGSALEGSAGSPKEALEEAGSSGLPSASGASLLVAPATTISRCFASALGCPPKASSPMRAGMLPPLHEQFSL